MGLFSRRKPAEEKQEIFGWASAMTPARDYPDWLPDQPDSMRLYETNWPFYAAAGQAGAILCHTYLRNPESPVVRREGADSDERIWQILNRARSALVLWYAESRHDADDAGKLTFVELSLLHLPADPDDDEQALALWRVISGQTGALREPATQLPNLANWIVAPLGLGQRMGNEVNNLLDSETAKRILEASLAARVELAEQVGEEVAEALTRTYGPGFEGIEANLFLGMHLGGAANRMDELMQALADAKGTG